MYVYVHFLFDDALTCRLASRVRFPGSEREWVRTCSTIIFAASTPIL